MHTIVYRPHFDRGKHKKGLQYRQALNKYQERLTQTRVMRRTKRRKWSQVACFQRERDQRGRKVRACGDRVTPGYVE
jgi:hypothetical protein